MADPPSGGGSGGPAGTGDAALIARALVYPSIEDGQVAVKVACVICGDLDLVAWARREAAVPDPAVQGGAESFVIEMLNAVVGWHYGEQHPEFV